MPTWNADQYLKFASERTQPARDLVARIARDAPRRVIDLGCGPGNSTALLAARWPGADLLGLDSSMTMINQANHDHPEWRWAVGDIAEWANEQGNQYDVVFSNAAMQWVDDHEAVYPALFRRVAPGGALAVQVPANLDAPAHRQMRHLAATPAWASQLPHGGVREWYVHEPEFYYDLLASQALRVDLWVTDYVHVMDGAAGIVEWYKGTGLRPFLDALRNDAERANFLADYTDRITEAYPAQPDGRVLFPFRRFFLIAYR
jgi:trans-aconitate 2-methyltransferase